MNSGDRAGLKHWSAGPDRDGRRHQASEGDERSAASWDQAAATYDEPADHGLRDPSIRAAWAGLLARNLPTAPSRIADIGCGTGSLTILAADLGHRVDGIDFSDHMLALALTKAAGRADVSFANGDASRPALPERSYHAVMCRHVLWTVPDPAEALRAWSRLLLPSGRLILIEGSWSTGVGLSRDRTIALLQERGFHPRVESLTGPEYWGMTPGDDRYLAVAELGA